jgi:hypothetical protein
MSGDVPQEAEVQVLSRARVGVKRGVPDRELKVINSVMKLIDSLDDEVQGRVISYLFQRYCPPIS